MLIRRLTAAVFCGYFHAALFFGLKEHVYRVTCAWSSARNAWHAKGNAAWIIQDVLIEKRGFHRCPSCSWATAKRDEHIDVPGSYCARVENESLGFYVEDELDQQIDQLALDIARDYEQRFGSSVPAYG